MFGKKVLLLAVLALALPAAAFASSQVDFSNMGGTLAGTNAGLTLTGSTLIAVNGLNGGGLITGSNLGSVSFSTGALATGSLQAGGTFAAGGSFSVMGNGSNGVPNGVLFSGSFSRSCMTSVSSQMGQSSARVETRVRRRRHGDRGRGAPS